MHLLTSILLLAVAAGLFCYLFYSLLRPEKL